MPNFLQNALNMFLSNTQPSQITPVQQNYIDVLKSGDATKGEELANNLCSSMGMTKEQAIAQAKQFFGI